MPSHGVSFAEATRVWFKIAMLSFGGPAGQIAVVYRILVDEKRWIADSRFLHALNYCMLLPGPEAQQLATYIGWLLHRTAGGMVAGGLFILPGAIAIMFLSYIYAGFGHVGFIAAIFFSLKAAVLAIVILAVVRVGKRALRNSVMVGLAAAAFIGIFFFDAPFPLIIIAAGLIGSVAARAGRPESGPLDRRNSAPLPAATPRMLREMTRRGALRARQQRRSNCSMDYSVVLYWQGRAGDNLLLGLLSSYAVVGTSL